MADAEQPNGLQGTEPVAVDIADIEQPNGVFSTKPNDVSSTQPNDNIGVGQTEEMQGTELAGVMGTGQADAMQDTDLVEGADFLAASTQPADQSQLDSANMQKTSSAAPVAVQLRANEGRVAVQLLLLNGDKAQSADSSLSCSPAAVNATDQGAATEGAQADCVPSDSLQRQDGVQLKNSLLSQSHPPLLDTQVWSAAHLLPCVSGNCNCTAQACTNAFVGTAHGTLEVS